MAARKIARHKPATPELRAIFKAELIKLGGQYQTSRRLAPQYAMRRCEAIEVYNEVESERRQKKQQVDQRIIDAAKYANQYTIGRYRLAEMFEIPISAAKEICSEVQAKREKSQEGRIARQDQAIDYIKRTATFATVESVATRFDVSTKWTRAAFDQVLGKNKKPAGRVRTVRRFIDLSGTDATSDRRRYPSGVGFGVEVVR